MCNPAHPNRLIGTPTSIWGLGAIVYQFMTLHKLQDNFVDQNWVPCSCTVLSQVNNIQNPAAPARNQNAPGLRWIETYGNMLFARAHEDYSA